MAIKVHPSIFTHPGPWLRRNFVEPYHLTVQATATALGVTRVAMSNLLNGKAALSAEMAMRFEKAFGVSAETLMRMQTAYDLAQVREHADELVVERIAKAA
ncbi:HigA family addiction module antitoxin [Novosphingobium aerophilum]|uniref:HigA family addiction module antitoxin n=1 Tax=Novosphingobium aerophilum TaxID=2839843 RepID=UPI003FD47E22